MRVRSAFVLQTFLSMHAVAAAKPHTLARIVRGVLLDIDGTLLDSNEAHAAAFTDALAEERVYVAFSRVRPLIGMGADKLLPALGVDAKSKTGERIARRKKEIFRERYLPQIRPFRGARDLLAHMKKLEIARVVATSAGDDELHDLLHAAKIEDFIEHETSSSDAKASKPDPDIVEVAIAKSHLDRRELVMLGDTPYDVEAALRAGVRIVAFRCGRHSDEDLAGAVEIYDDPADLLLQFGRSILSR